MKGISIRRRRGAYEWEDTKAEAKGTGPKIVQQYCPYP